MAKPGAGSGHSVFNDIEHQLSQMKRAQGESDEEFAERLYQRQTDVYAANIGRDCWEPGCDRTNSFAALKPSVRAGWIKMAKQKG